MIPYKHTEEELRELSHKTDKANNITSTANSYNDEFLRVYSNLIKNEVQLELDKYQYLINKNVVNGFDKAGKIVNLFRFYGGTILVYVELSNFDKPQLKSFLQLTLSD